MAKKQLTLEEKLQDALVPVEEQPYQIPENWCWAKLGSVCDIILGQSPKKDDITEDASCIPVISGAGELKDNSIETEKYTKAAARLAQAGDVVISAKVILGKPVVADKEYCLGRGMNAIRSNAVDSMYTKFLILNFEDYLYKNASSSKPIQLAGKALGNMPVPLPPVPEQKRIASLIEPMLADLNAAEEKIQSVLDGAELRKKAIIHGGVTGKLTSFWRKIKGVSIDGWCTKSLDSEDIYEPFREWLKKSDCVEQPEADSQETDSQPVEETLALEEKQDIQVSVPTMHEQQEISSILRNLLAKERTVNASCEQSLASIGIIKKAILSRAFRGELGTNDSSEEAAINLVKEILQ
ncbi:Type I restriction-modification system, specificity subunit S [Anaerovibrio sp. JC8]|uniref:restriction endonuclease subunit S n=1 Tax=Anaerovibrio sp. JC8 TaxID=1240085 RepID=UPI000A0A2247|nr:restriction endonuclease subunit S [Anaerovibrio sp. JC8]ORU00200.1 Type I restriction-modification system, specificity subunit S [Anaerovibrio sp. JC8]